MYETDQNMPELMRRATRALRPDSAAIVRRALEQGRRRRQRRTAAIGIATASALVLTGVGVATAISRMPSKGDGQGNLGVAVAPKPSARKPSAPKPSASATKPAKSAAKTLAALLKVIPDSFAVSDHKHWLDKTIPGVAGARVTVDDGKGASELRVAIQRGQSRFKDGCFRTDAPGRTCQELRDGSIAYGIEMDEVPDQKHPGVAYNMLEIHRADDIVIVLHSYTARDATGSPKTRERPPFTIAQLTSMGQSNQWKTAVP